MTTIQSVHNYRNFHRLSRVNTRPERERKPSLQAFIASSEEHGTSFYAAVIYAGQRRVHCLEGFLENTSAERAWLYASSLVYEWRDSHHPNTRLLFRSNDEQSDRREWRRAA